ncbi:MAG: CPA2 family monovalent cation:H+ antiporter-2 [Paraglaciecola sp.]
MDSLLNKKIICQALLNYDSSAQVVVKISSLAETQFLHGIGITDFVHAYQETARLLVKSSLAHRKVKGPMRESE